MVYCKKLSNWKLSSIIIAFTHGRTHQWLHYVLPPNKNWWSFCSEQLQRQIMYISKWLDIQEKLIEIFTTSTFCLKYKEINKNDIAALFFGLFFVPANGRAKSTKWLKTTVLLFLHLLEQISLPLFEVIEDKRGHWIKKWEFESDFFSRIKSNQSIYLKD